MSFFDRLWGKIRGRRKGRLKIPDPVKEKPKPPKPKAKPAPPPVTPKPPVVVPEPPKPKLPPLVASRPAARAVGGGLRR